MITTVNYYNVNTVETIVYEDHEVKNLDDAERMARIRNMIHLNQVSPMIAANMDYFDITYIPENGRPSMAII